MLQTLQLIEIILAVLLIFVVLIQNKNVALNLSSMSGWMAAATKRWAEKTLHNATIILGTAFILNSTALFLFS